MSESILVVADTAEKAEALRGALAGPGRDVVLARTLEDGWRRFQDAPPAAVVIDWDLADGKALAFCARLREAPGIGAVPIALFIDAGRPGEVEKGFAAKADACLPRPLAPKPLALWVESLLRQARRAEKEGGVARADGVVVDPRTRTVTLGARVVDDLTEKEFSLFHALVRRRPQVLSKEFIMGTLWRAVLRDNTVEVHVKNLRAKLGPDGARVVTVPKAGYRFE